MGSYVHNHHHQYAAFTQPGRQGSRIGHYDLEKKTIVPLSFASGTPVTDLYQVIEAGASNIIAGGVSIPASEVKILAPISGRDVLAVAKNYVEHASEFNNSGYDSSDKVALPSHPVIFTKRATSIIADGDEIHTHPEFTKSLDYEGEIGVIIGRRGFRIAEKDAMDYVWGYTIINDVTARERQRDHKQFYLGKSADSYCPMGPIAVAKEDLPSVIRVETHVNGQLRQSATSKDLIFSFENLIATISEAETLQPGDVIATGTPAGVGIGKSPPVFLNPGDEMAVSITGLGDLKNRVSLSESSCYEADTKLVESYIDYTNGSRALEAGVQLTSLNGKPLYYKKLGAGKENVVFVHGLGGSTEYWTPLVSRLSLDQTHTLHLFDLEGHGLSPTHPLSHLTIESFSEDIRSVFEHAGASSSEPATLVAHSLGCLAALKFALDNPTLVKKLILFGPPPSPLPEAGSKGSIDRASLVRSKGMTAVVDAVAGAGTSDYSKKTNPVGVAATRMSLLSQDPESYAKACGALAGATQELAVERLQASTLIVTGQEDKVSPPALCEKYASRVKGSSLVVLENVGHWHIFEDVAASAEAVKNFI